MKRIYALLAATMLVIGVAGQASAEMFYGGIIGTNTEMGIELGDSMTETKVINLFNANDIGATFDGDTSLADLSVAGLANHKLDDGRTLRERTVWFAVDEGLTADDITTSYALLDTVNSVYRGVEAKTFTDGVMTDSLDSGGVGGFASGTYAGFVGPVDAGATSLADLAVGNDIVMDIWVFDNGDDHDEANDTLNMTEYKLVISMEADGMVSAEVTQVPVPGALVLLGSGLLALVGVRRKNA